MVAYKLFRVLKDGSISSLFINKKERYQINVWMTSQDIPTKGFKRRAGWHSLCRPHAPHLSNKGRAWFEVDIKDFSTEKRPPSQGGNWFLSKQIKIIKRL